MVVCEHLVALILFCAVLVLLRPLRGLALGFKGILNKSKLSF